MQHIFLLHIHNDKGQEEILIVEPRTGKVLGTVYDQVKEVMAVSIQLTSEHIQEHQTGCRTRIPK